MFKINKKIEYALMVLKHFDQTGLEANITARQICDIYHTPFDSTSKVMQIMCNNNILSSSQGIKGGYQLAADLNFVNYLELAELIEGKSFNHNCFSIQCSLIESCNITGPVSRLNQYLNYFFKTLSIKDLLADNAGPLNLIQQTVREA